MWLPFPVIPVLTVILLGQHSHGKPQLHKPLPWLSHPPLVTGFDFSLPIPTISEIFSHIPLSDSSISHAYFWLPWSFSVHMIVPLFLNSQAHPYHLLLKFRFYVLAIEPSTREHRFPNYLNAECFYETIHKQKMFKQQLSLKGKIPQHSYMEKIITQIMPNNT